MNRAGRLAGAILVETAGEYFLVGNLKRPCNFPAAGFETPAVDVDALTRPWLRLQRSGPLAVTGPWLAFAPELAGEDLAASLARRLVIERNGSVSDRLWRLILTPDPDGDDPPPDAVIDARWLIEVPGHIWQVVREAVLKCVRPRGPTATSDDRR